MICQVSMLTFLSNVKMIAEKYLQIICQVSMLTFLSSVKMIAEKYLQIICQISMLTFLSSVNMPALSAEDAGFESCLQQNCPGRVIPVT